MTTRAGIVAILAGVLGAIVANILSFLNVPLVWIFIVLIPVFVVSGWFAGQFASIQQIWNRYALGLLAGGLSGIIAYLFWGASSLIKLTGSESIQMVVQNTLEKFFALILLGVVCGSFSIRIKIRIRKFVHKEIDLSDPQMGMNAAISAVAATLFNLILTILFYTRLGEISQQPALSSLPVLIAIFMLFVAHLSLTLVLPHEAKMAQHRSGLNEVKMAAFVSIANAAAFTAIIFLLHPVTLRSPLAGTFLLFSWVLSLTSLWILFKKILPRRKELPTPQTQKGQKQALLFGSIGSSIPGRLVTLCIGCGIVIALPMCITLISVGLNLAAAGFLGSSAFTQMLAQSRLSLTLWQILLNGGLMLAFAAILSAIYMFYLFLGRKFGSISEQ
ncbi:MAG: hypothetical protein VB013_07030 [Anaerolineaceae bacterium]|nr:hypothetical protein [Anaerolineaceae bacterium]